MASPSQSNVFDPCPSPFNMAAHVLGFSNPDPYKIALSVLSHSGAKRWNYRDLRALVLKTAQGFLDSGLKSGDKVLIRLGNTVDFPVCYLAALAIDMVPVPTSPQLTQGEVDRIVDDLSPRGLVQGPDTAKSSREIDITITPQDIEKYKDKREAQYVFGDPNRLGYIVYTSGTSGKPRAVMHAHRAIWARQMMIRDWYDLRESDRVLHAGAFNWTFTLGTGLMDPWTMGATALIADATVQLEALPLLLKRHDATLFAAAPGVYRRLLKRPELLSLSKLRHSLSAGEKLSPSIAQNWIKAAGSPIYEAFGMSECSTFISGAPQRPAEPNALGYAQRGRRVEILPIQDGTDPVPPNTEGCIAVHKEDAGLMLGYFGQPIETQSKFRGDWFITGDLGSKDEHGVITYHGRHDDMMNAGGFRVSPIEVETILSQHPDIQAVAVKDIEIKEDVSLIHAFYVADKEIPKTELFAFASQHLASYKQPKEYKRIKRLPTGANGKLSRKELVNFLGATLG